MTAAVLLLYVVLFAWIVGGAIWLFSKRRYRPHQAGQFAMDLLGAPVEAAQAIWGRGGVPYAFLLPNMLIFGFFTFLPMILNFWVSLTSGESIDLFSRPFAGLANYTEIFSCESIFDPRSCANAGLSFWRAMGNTLLFVLIQVPVMCAVALMTALVVNKSLAARGFWRAMFFYPVMLSPVVIANIWQWILHRKGVLNAALDQGADALTAVAGLGWFDITFSVLVAMALLVFSERTMRAGREPSLLWASLFAATFVAVTVWADPAQLIGARGHLSLWAALLLAGGMLWLVGTVHRQWRSALIAAGALAVAMLLTIQFDAVFDFAGFRPVNWLVQRNTGWPFFWLVFVFTWSHMGFYMLILLAGLQAIPRDLYEAAKMDSAKPIRVFFRITMPLVMPTFTVVVVLCLIRSFQIFDEVYLLTGGGPARETFMVVQNIYEVAFATDNPDYGEAAAGSVLMAIVIAVFTFFQLFITRRQSEL